MVNTDDSIKRYKPPTELNTTIKPIIPCGERMEMLAALACVDFVVPFPDPDPVELLKKLQPQICLIGEEWKGRAPEEILAPDLKILYSKRSRTQSTTQIINDVFNKTPIEYT
jgi:D-beta-D-heptose 7-phosphate kinase/D-beta-D-heptose 1-phosphate adenosyltransferase